ncbi:PTS system glucose-specific IIA component [Lactobacillus colini]|uniref:PTS system glucose-specific IIA component n=1 Tax=Lactobacillus colini TaxID=1819254 RepID=A0ABS4MDW3_9LACO|nr:PTS glucose transporter subunit IIA [Lactobacillus colini]MBP2057878.1 PTS system glucose-specific IIA component [Lactobacillus colini]
MFNFFKKKKGLEVCAVADGEIMPITKVKDDVFSTKMLGDGYAIKPSNGDIFSPVDGTISTLFPTKHAIGVKTKDGLEILIHLGLDTVELKGAPFEVMVEQGDEVKAGQQLASMDLKQITDSGRDDSAIVVYTNMDIINSLDPEEVAEGNVSHGNQVQTIHFK